MPLKKSAKILVHARPCRELVVQDIHDLSDALKEAKVPVDKPLTFASERAIGIELAAPEEPEENHGA